MKSSSWVVVKLALLSGVQPAQPTKSWVKVILDQSVSFVTGPWSGRLYKNLLITLNSLLYSYGYRENHTEPVPDLIFYKNAETARRNSSDYNLFSHRDRGVKISWTGNKGYGITHTNLRAFAMASGQETHSLTADPIWVNRVAGNYALKAGSPAVGSGCVWAEGFRGEMPAKIKGHRQRTGRQYGAGQHQGFLKGHFGAISCTFQVCCRSVINSTELRVRKFLWSFLKIR